MTRYVAFLRSLNVGGHTVKMDDLRRHFEAMAFAEAETFIASGNVIFESNDADAAALEKRIEDGLKAALGYEVATFLRTDAEVAAAAARSPFPTVDLRQGDHLYVVFLRDRPDPAAAERVRALTNDGDLLDVHEREMYWLRRGRLLDTALKNADFRRALGPLAVNTSRNMNTVQRLAEKYPPGSP